MKTKIPIVKRLCVLFFIPFSLLSYDYDTFVYVFDSYSKAYPQKMILVGEVKTKVKFPEVKSKEFSIQEYDARKDLVTVKVINNKGLKIGQILYIVYKHPHHEKYKHALIMGEIKVLSILNHPFYGLVLTGVGNLLRVREGYFVVRTLDSENIDKAYIFQRRGDSYFNDGDWDKAKEQYLIALQQDKDLVEAHYSLGKLYYNYYKKENNEISLQNALMEFRKVWNLREKFRYYYIFSEYIFNYFNALLDDFYSKKYGTLNENLATLQEMEKVSSECKKISQHIECQMMEAVSYYYLMEVFSLENSKEKREMYSLYKMKAGNLFKSIEEEKNKEIRENRIDLSISMRIKNSYLDPVHYEFVLIKYYYGLLREIQDIQKNNQKRVLINLLIRHIEFYFNLTKDKQEFHNMNLIIFHIRNHLKKNEYN